MAWSFALNRTRFVGVFQAGSRGGGGKVGPAGRSVQPPRGYGEGEAFGGDSQGVAHEIEGIGGGGSRCECLAPGLSTHPVSRRSVQFFSSRDCGWF